MPVGVAGVNSAISSRNVPFRGTEHVLELPLQSAESSQPEKLQPTGAVAVMITLEPETYVA